MGILGSISPSGTELGFLQRRVSLFGLVGAILGFGFLSFRLVLWVLAGTNDGEVPSLVYHFLGSFPLLMVWFLTRKGNLSLGLVRGIEITGLVLSCVAYEAMGTQIPLASQPSMIVLLALTYGFICRSAFVPSTPELTLILSGIVGVPLLLFTYQQHAASPDILAWYAQGTGQPVETVTAAGITIYIAAWWTMTMFTSTAVSRVTYGLRRQARTAQQLGQYTLVEKLGEGGVGTVYRATHAMLRRPTAVKILRPDRAGAEDFARFEREVQLTAELTHPNTITVFDFGRTPEGIFYYAMEYLDGATLDKIVERAGPLPPGRVAHILEQAAGSLEEAHARNLIHRDIKPANVLLCEQGGIPDVVKVLDFGLVKLMDAKKSTAGLTQANVVAGTPLYMSPEMITTPDRVDARSDIYSLGALGYFLTTGTQVFSGSTPVEVCSHHLHSTPELPSKRLGQPVPDELESLLMQCLEKDPAQRPQSASEMIQRLWTCCSPNAWPREEARKWWNDNRDALRPSGAPLAVDTGLRTMAVDIHQRCCPEDD